MTAPREHPLFDALARGDMVAVNSSDYALIILVSNTGTADVINNEPTTPAYAAQILREVADSLDRNAPDGP